MEEIRTKNTIYCNLKATNKIIVRRVFCVCVCIVSITRTTLILILIPENGGIFYKIHFTKPRKTSNNWRNNGKMKNAKKK